MAATSDLKLRRELINPNFEGYKLSLDTLPVYRTAIQNGVDRVALRDDQFSYHHATLFGVNNHLTSDPWDQDSVYLVDNDWNIQRATAHDTSVDCSGIVFTIPDAGNQQLSPARHNVRLHFLSADLVVIGNGVGQLHILQTGDRKQGNDKWKVLLSKPVVEEKEACLLVDAMEVTDGENHMIECLLVHVTEATPEEKDKFSSQYLTRLEWVTFTSVNRTSWTLSRTRELVGRRPFHYATLGRSGGSITVAGEAVYKFTRDSEVPVVSDEEKEEVRERVPDYTWHQTAEDVTVQFTVPAAVTKADVYMTLTANRVDFGLKNSSELLKGNLHADVEVESSTWTIDGQRIDLVLTKQTEGMWPTVVVGDTRGEMLVNPEEAAAIHERLAHLTSEEWNPDPNKAEKPYNCQQLEDCDTMPDDDFLLLRLDGNSHSVTHKTSLGSHQWLFNSNMEHNASPAICLRHDVDGLLWKQEPTTAPTDPAWTHCATFNAFGYVQASKQQRKFTACPPDWSYAVISDLNKHIYIYRQSTPVSTPLRNRKTGQQVNSVAKQQVISLDTTDNILGLQATNDKLFVATEKYLHFIKI